MQPESTVFNTKTTPSAFSLSTVSIQFLLAISFSVPPTHLTISFHFLSAVSFQFNHQNLVFHQFFIPASASTISYPIQRQFIVYSSSVRYQFAALPPHLALACSFLYIDTCTSHSPSPHSELDLDCAETRIWEQIVEMEMVVKPACISLYCYIIQAQRYYHN